MIRISELSSNFICVFRIPFAEKQLVADAFSTISDVMSAHMLTVPPINVENMVDYIIKKLDKMGYKIIEENDCKQAIEECIVCEKSDGSFLGYRTLDKIINNIIYEHILHSAKNNEMDAELIPSLIMKVSGVPQFNTNPWNSLNTLIGLDGVKQQVAEIIAQIKTHKKLVAEGKSVEKPSIHMLFTGSPGTGKTTLARIIAEIFKEEGILTKGSVHEIRGRDLCGKYIGETAPKTAAICRDAMGSVLFIDEAYSLYRTDNSGKDYGREALDTLIAEMENYRGDFCVILAGYTDEMDDLLKGNVGLRSRVPYTVEFPNYSTDELEKIFFGMIKEKFEYTEEFKEKAHQYFQSLPKEFVERKEFGNARFVRNLFETVWGKAAYRCSLSGENDVILSAADLESATRAGELECFEKKKHRQIGFGFNV